MKRRRLFETEGDEPRDDAIPNLPENAEARKFLATAPSKGLWQPLGKEVKVMQCFRCRAYGHRSSDRECPLNQTGNLLLDSERIAREDPMAIALAKKRIKAETTVSTLKALLDDIHQERKRSREVDASSCSSSSSSSSAPRKKKKKHRKQHRHHHRKEKKRKRRKKCS